MGTRRHRIHVTRDAVLFAVGLAGIAWETLGSEVERPALLVLFAGMIGLPTFLRLDAAKDDVYRDEDDK